MSTTLFENTTAFAGFSVDDADRAATFYRDTLGLTVNDAGEPGVLLIDLLGGAQVLAYAKPNHRSSPGSPTRWATSSRCSRTTEPNSASSWHPRGATIGR